MIKGPIHHEDTTIINIHAPDSKTPKYMKQKLTEIKGKRDNSAIIVGDFCTSFSTVDRKLGSRSTEKWMT